MEEDFLGVFVVILVKVLASKVLPKRLVYVVGIVFEQSYVRFDDSSIRLLLFPFPLYFSKGAGTGDVEMWFLEVSTFVDVDVE